MILDIDKLSIGDKVWVVDFRKDDIFWRQTRWVRPTYCLVVSNEETKETVYYSDYHFKELKKDWSTYSKVIKPYDNTWFRQYKWIPIRVFDNYEECFKEFQNQVSILIKRTEDYKAKIYDDCDKLIESFKSEITK